MLSTPTNCDNARPGEDVPGSDDIHASEIDRGMWRLLERSEAGGGSRFATSLMSYHC